MTGFLKRLNDGEILLADGATGTNLQKMGLPAGTVSEELVFDNPDLLVSLEKEFVKAGSDIILTCTFGGTSIRLKESKYRDRVAEINEKAAEIARSAAISREGVLVGGSIGPTGELIKPFGPLDPENASGSFQVQAKALANGGVDLFVIETMFSIEEATLAFDAVRSVSDLPIVVSFSYDRGTRTMMGVKPAQVITTFSAKGADVVGANCGTSLENMEKIIKEYADTVPGFPLWAKPNAGLPTVDSNNQAIYTITPEQMGEAASRFIAIGAHVVGGCCGSSPDHIAGIARTIRHK